VCLLWDPWSDAQAVGQAIFRCLATLLAHAWANAVGGTSCTCGGFLPFWERSFHRDYPRICACRAWAGSRMRCSSGRSGDLAHILFATPFCRAASTLRLWIDWLELLFQCGDRRRPPAVAYVFWFYSHPAVYSCAARDGILSEIPIGWHSRKPIFGYKRLPCVDMGLVCVGLLVWGHIGSTLRPGATYALHGDFHADCRTDGDSRSFWPR